MAAKFSPSDAAVSVFSFAKQNPKFTLKYLVIIALASLLIGFIMAFSGLYEFNNHMQGLNPNSGDLGPMLEGFKLLNWPLIILSLALNMIIGASVSAFGLRKVVLNQEAQGFALTFGQDEKNLLMASLIIGGIVFLGIFVISFISAFFAKILPFLGIIIPVLMILGMVFVFGRLGQFGIYSILNKTNGLKESYNITKDQFWSYIGAYFLCFIIFIIFSLIIITLLNPIFSFLFKGMYFSNPVSKDEAIAIGTLLHQFVTSLIGGFANLAFICVGGFIYHQISSQEEINTQTEDV